MLCVYKCYVSEKVDKNGYCILYGFFCFVFVENNY